LPKKGKGENKLLVSPKIRYRNHQVGPASQQKKTVGTSPRASKGGRQFDTLARGLSVKFCGGNRPPSIAWEVQRLDFHHAACLEFETNFKRFAFGSPLTLERSSPAETPPQKTQRTKALNFLDRLGPPVGRGCRVLPWNCGPAFWVPA